MLSAPDGYPLGVPRRLTTHRPPIGRLRRAWGAAAMAVRHLRTLPITERHRTEGDATDLPAPWPLALVDRRTKTVADGHGPLYHRTFTVRAVDVTHGAAELIETLSQDLDRGSRRTSSPSPASAGSPARCASATSTGCTCRRRGTARCGCCRATPPGSASGRSTGTSRPASSSSGRPTRGRASSSSRSRPGRGRGTGGRDRLPAPRGRSRDPGRALAAVLPRCRASHRGSPRRVGVRRHAPCPRLRAAGLTNLRSAVGPSQPLLRGRS